MVKTADASLYASLDSGILRGSFPSGWRNVSAMISQAYTGLAISMIMMPCPDSLV